MEKWDKPLRDHRKQHNRENPSFSSTLLDVIYRSIDEGQTEEKEEKLIFYRETMRKQKQNNCFREEGEAEKLNFRRARKVENRSEKVVRGRNSLTEIERRTRSNSNTLSMHSTSTSSESSSVGGFSSSESESFYGVQRPKPIRTSVSEKKTNFDALHGHRNHSTQTQKPKHENGFGKTKSKALRILYGELKKAKQPISPGARLASFLNSLFNSGGNAKKAKVSTSVVDSKSAQPSSTCSSVSSFTRSCLSKTPSSRSGAKRSVRFCTESVIVDEDCRPCGHKNLHEGEEGLVANSAMKKNYGKNSNEELRFHVMQESRRVEELARDLLKNYQKKNEVDFDLHYEDEDDDDAVSCSSSDLFELDNLSAIGIERYREELPVYETTHFNTNRAIANGFIL
ncbi:protein BIG GRAIN 1-like B [Gastrolobium bilobum]|uniref:protein BIG GRAIN 1-like B n=1 Tax=Gastrolobium bilobum TaxID=150636 RepID=UPI002AAF7EBF|nr:protein BIG GRAIN 1-like B [Gastrolobium bilobum]